MISRAQPQLGTFVDMRCDDTGAGALSEAFRAVAAVEALMSFHRADSGLSELNCTAHRSPVAVHPWTWRVLELCRFLHRASGGVFDPTVARLLVARGALPAPDARLPDPKATFADVEFLDRRRIFFRRRLWIDLGGIAKGFAVDVAIATLRARGVRQATVNAGGDLRIMGGRAEEIWLRDPRSRGRLVRCGMLRNGACATSGSGFAGDWPILAASSDAQPRTASVTVLARRCTIADALTKIVALAPRAARPLLDHYGAIVAEPLAA